MKAVRAVGTAALFISIVCIVAAVLWAGAPPPDVIPWRSVPAMDTIGNVIVYDTIFYITRDQYIADVLGTPDEPRLRRTMHKLAVIEALLVSEARKEHERP